MSTILVIGTIISLFLGFYCVVDKVTTPTEEEEKKAWNDVFEEIIHQSLK